MVNLRDFPIIAYCLGWYYNDPCHEPFDLSEGFSQHRRDTLLHHGAKQVFGFIKQPGGRGKTGQIFATSSRRWVTINGGLIWEFLQNVLNSG